MEDIVDKIEDVLDVSTVTEQLQLINDLRAVLNEKALVETETITEIFNTLKALRLSLNTQGISDHLIRRAFAKFMNLCNSEFCPGT